MAYIPPPGPRYTVGSVGTSLNYLGAQPPSAQPLPPRPSPSTLASSGSIRYASQPVGTFNINTAALFPQPSVSSSSLSSFSPAAAPLNNAPLGSIRYGP